MRKADRTLLEWVGADGVAAVLRHSLDRASLVRIANARRVSVPGMRNQSVPVDRLARALAEKFQKDDAAARVLLVALDTTNRKTFDEIRRQTDDEVRTRAADERLTGPAAARLLYVLSREKREPWAAEAARALKERAVVRSRRDEAAEPAAESEAERTDRDARIAGLESGLEQAKLREKALQKELAQKKFDLNNTKLLLTRGREHQERLEKELSILQKSVDEGASRRRGAPPDELLGRIGQIEEQQRKLATALEKIGARLVREEKTADRAAASGKTLEEIRRDLTALKKDAAAGRTSLDAALRDLAASQAALLESVGALKTAPAKPAAKARAARKAARDGPERAGLFVDVQNVFYGARQQNARLDFEALLQTVSVGRRMLRTVAYVVETKEIDQSAFIALLQQRGYEVRRKPLMVRADGSSKGDWDMEIALDVLDVCEALDVLILVTGDGDFTSLVNRVKPRGVEVEVYSFPRNTAKSLREAATRFFAIDRRLLIKLPKDDREPGLFPDLPPARETA